MPVRMTARQATTLVTQRSKYGVSQSAAGKLARTYGGRVFDSQAEMRLAQELDIRKRAGDIQDWWPQVAIPLNVNGKKVAKLIADFKVLHKDDKVEYMDMKGFATPVFKLKLKLLQAIYPDMWFTVAR